MFKTTRSVLLVALVSGLAACNDGSVAPRGKSADAANVSGSGVLTTLTMTDTVRFTFVINPTVAQSVYLGAGNSVRFPAGSVCEPSSSYGASEWDNACTPATDPITVSASAWLEADGHPRVDFASHLRFVPSANPLAWVTLVFTDTAAASDPTASILYCTTAYSACVSELSGDATLVTVKNPTTGFVTRRIKHFSGYLIGTGDACYLDDGITPCSEGGAGMNKIAGGLKLPSASTASANIGPEGGVLELPSAGLSVVVPRGAVSKMTAMSVTSRPGQLLSYQFAPHGIQFAVPLRVTQNISGTDMANGSLTGLRAVYFADESQVNDASASVVPTELMNVQIDRTAGTASFEIHHFSGYMFATGDDSEMNDNRIGGRTSSLGTQMSGIKRAAVGTTRLQF